MEEEGRTTSRTSRLSAANVVIVAPKVYANQEVNLQKRKQQPRLRATCPTQLSLLSLKYLFFGHAADGGPNYEDQERNEQNQTYTSALTSSRV